MAILMTIGYNIVERLKMPKGHKENCQCFICKGKRGERFGINSPRYNQSVSRETRQKFRLAKLGTKQSEKTKRKRSKSLKQAYANGSRKSWNKSLTKKTDKRVAQSAQKIGGGLKQAYVEGRRNLDNIGLKNHKISCQCSFCKARRGELKGKDSINYGKTGKKNGMWNNGSSFEPYTSEFNNQLKQLIRQRDNYQCQFCGINENGRAHDVHHINYIKKDSSKRNLIILCTNHNVMANTNRDKWQFLFETLQEIRQI